MRPSTFVLAVVVLSSTSADMLRKSIVFDAATPDVFYCPVDKFVTSDKLYVVSRPLKKLCEFKGDRLPEDYKSDCYNDVDETEFACSEKKRIMMRLNPPGFELNEEELTNEIV